ncbi:hypothetical protein D1AOALGA4SA_10873 [Olavius algarvensis Delta 1 endosymbiont]|nr:hypothetical protein D1AOALGA4SA_10873 [Olavius algarvensis Delta 1 endosymbiont]
MTDRQSIKSIFLLVGIWCLTGCAAVIIGAGAGVGTYTYIKGELKRSYPAKFDKTLQVCVDILADLDQPILAKTTDGERTTVRSKRKDGTDQTIQVSIVSIDSTEVSVRTGVIGYRKKEISLQFHEFIAERIER